MKSESKSSVSKDLNVNLSCPYKVGHYQMKSFQIPTLKYLPVPNCAHFCLEMFVYGKVKGAKKTTEVQTNSIKGFYKFEI